VFGFTEIVSGYSSPAVTTSGCPTPLRVVTVSQVEPDVAVKEIGAPLVDILTSCVAGELGGETKFRVVVLNVSVDEAGITTNVTGIVTGATPVTVTVTDELYVLAERLVGFTRTIKLPGTVPLTGPTVSHGSVPGLVAVKVGVPELAFTVTV
jgi:hypothetical protein